eukprot:629054-Amphidinium_carterae.1
MELPTWLWDGISMSKTSCSCWKNMTASTEISIPLDALRLGLNGVSSPSKHKSEKRTQLRAHQTNVSVLKASFKEPSDSSTVIMRKTCYDSKVNNSKQRF